MCVEGNDKAQGVDYPTNNDVIHLTFSTFVVNFTKLMKPTQFIQMMARMYKRINNFHLNLYIKLFVNSPKLKGLSWAKTQGTIKKPRWTKNKGKKYKMKLINASISVFPWISPYVFLFPSFISLLCTLTIGFSFFMRLDKVTVFFMSEKCCKLQVWRFKVQVTNVKCRVFEWMMDTMSEKCFKLQVWGFNCECEV